MREARVVWLLIPVLNVLQQVFLKYTAETASGDLFEWLYQLATSPWFLMAIGAEIICFVIWMKVLAELDLSVAFPLTTVSYVLVMAVAWLYFGERLGTTEIVGSILIMAGAWCIAGSSEQDAQASGPVAENEVAENEKALKSDGKGLRQ